ncbi:MAG: hypothetical protein A2Z07_07380 [Armatimonadetes bacterium RBG_16_67_12]|nr:MAG: hypothetical protein A2Z07_07380 [Armatimonadetes bacterium RBG_16_67_12]
MRRADLLIGIALLAFAAFYFQESSKITIGFAADRLGPKFFPQLLAAALGSAALALVWRSLRGRSDPEPLQPMRVRLFLWTVVSTLTYVLLLPSLGYLIATPLYLVAIILLLGYRNVAGLVATTAGVTAVLYLVFARTLHVLVPMGPLGR